MNSFNIYGPLTILGSTLRILLISLAIHVLPVPGPYTRIPFTFLIPKDLCSFGCIILVAKILRSINSNCLCRPPTLSSWLSNCAKQCLSSYYRPELHLDMFDYKGEVYVIVDDNSPISFSNSLLNSCRIYDGLFGRLMKIATSLKLWVDFSLEGLKEIGWHSSMLNRANLVWELISTTFVGIISKSYIFVNLIVIQNSLSRIIQ